MSHTPNPHLVVGAGPAGLTAAHALLGRCDRPVIIVEASDAIGGISRTVRFDGNHMDLGGHRFFSKSDEVMDLWTQLLPVEESDGVADPEAASEDGTDLSTGGTPDGSPATGVGARSVASGEENRFLVRRRLSRILYGRKFFNYPVTLSMDTVMKLGPVRLGRIAGSYVDARLHPVSPERNLEDFFVNRFGRELYATFFRDYTAKVWGRSCRELSADWGAQRVKGLSVAGVLSHAAKSLLSSLLPGKGDLAQKDVETSLIGRFLYPKYGPGSFWEGVAEGLVAGGAELALRTRLVALELNASGTHVERAVLEGPEGTRVVEPASVFSSMPLRDLALALEKGRQGSVPKKPLEVATGLEYRDFLTVGLILPREKVTPRVRDLSDNWIYVQEPDVRVGRLQIFNNWSPWLPADPEGRLLLGLEYFCTEGDDLWSMKDGCLVRLAEEELEKIGFTSGPCAEGSHVERVEKAYPAYWGAYGEIDVLQDWLDHVDNLYPMGRNGMHRYNNMDHSMLSALRSVDRCLEAGGDGGAAPEAKATIWTVNAEKEYHETRTESGRKLP